jgi:hypothetical protein
MKKYIILLIFVLFSMNVFSMFDGDLYDSEQNTFLLANETIEIQKDQSQQESQLLSKEGEYRLKLQVRQYYYNHIWTMYRVTFLLFYEIIIMFIAVAFYRLIIFVVIELFPIVINKFLDFFEGWLRK